MTFDIPSLFLNKSKMYVDLSPARRRTEEKEKQLNMLTSGILREEKQK